MLAQRRAALPVQALAAHAVLGPVILLESDDNSYARLLDEGVLTEVRGDLFNDDLVKFSYPLVGAYAIVRRLLRSLKTGDFLWDLYYGVKLFFVLNQKVAPSAN